MAQQSYTQWLQSLPLVWLFGNKNGQADGAAQGATYDNNASLIKQASLARFTMQGPDDALPHIGNDSNLIQGVDETNDDYRVRLRTRWDDWARAGTPLELLVQLYWAGYGNAVIAQQNGLMYYLSGAPTAGEDPASLLVIENADSLIAPLTTQDSSLVIPDMTTTSSSPVTPIATPWFTFDDHTALSNRFCIILPTVPSTFTTHAAAVFDGTTDTVTATWSNSFTNTGYYVAKSILVTDGSGPIEVSITAKGQTSVTVTASAPFAGTVFLLAWNPGMNPFSSPHAGDINILKSIVGTWKNASAICVGVDVIIQGRLWGYPVQTWGDNTTWGPASSQFIAIGF